MPRMSAADRRVALVAAARRVIARDGVAEASVRRIVGEADMSLASFHYAFASRDELLAELVRETVAAERAAVIPDLEPGTDLHSAIERGFAGYLEHLRTAPEQELAMLELTWWALRTPERHDVLAGQYGQYIGLAAEALELVAEAAGLAWRVPVEQAARLLITLTDGLTVGWLVHRDDDVAYAVARAAADALSRMAEPR